MARTRLRCVPLEDRLAPSAGGSDPLAWHLLVNQFRTGSYQVYPLTQGVIQSPGGRILFAGGGYPHPVSTPGVSAFLPTGAVDQSFGDHGIALVPVNADPAANTTADNFWAIDVLPDGRIVVAGVVGPTSPTDGHRDVFVARLTPNGQLDPTFAGNGKAVFHIPNVLFEPSDVAPLPDGSVLLLGNGKLATGIPFPGAAVVRVFENGSLDTSFGSGGVFVAPSNLGLPKHVTVQPGTSRILLDFNPQGRLDVLALTPGGTIDPTFGDAGVASANLNLNAMAGDLFVRSDGAITLVTRSDYSDTPGFGILLVRITSDGQLDGDFGSHGSYLVPIPNSVGLTPNTSPVYLFAVTQGTAGSFLVYAHAAESFNDFYVDNVHDTVTRIQSFGEVDLSFGSQGSAPAVVTPTWVPEPFVSSITPDSGDMQSSGAPVGGGQVLDPSSGTLAPVGPVTFFPLFAGSVRTATADVNGDGTPDLIGGAGPAGGPHVIVIDGKSHQRMAEFFAFEKTFFGGVFVAAGDVNGDGKADLVVTPDQGGGPVVAVYDGAKLAARFNNDAQIARFYGIDDPDFRGGARPAVGDVNGDGKADLLISAGFLGGPRQALYDGAGLAPSGAPPKLMPDFFAFEDTLRNGTYVALGDLTGDGKAELIFGGGPGGAPRVRVFDGVNLLAAGPFQSLDEIPDAQTANFYAADETTRGGIRLAVGTVYGQRALLTGSGELDPAQVRVFTATTLLGSINPSPDQILDVFGSALLADGVFVG